MSFNTEKIKPSSYKIILVEIDIPAQNTNILNYEAGIWVIKLFWDGVTVTDDYGLTGYYADELPEANAIGSLRVDGINYTKVTSLANLRTQDSSFYFDKADQKIYIHFPDWHKPLSRIIALGITNGFCDKPQLIDNRPVNAYYNDIYYDPRVLAIPQIKQKKDKLFYGLIQHQGGSVQLNNADGELDDFADRGLYGQIIYGQAIRIKFGFNGLDYDDFRQIYAGYVDDITKTYDKLDIRFSDRRKFFQRELPIRTFNKTDYPNLSDDSVDLVKPLAWGTVRNAPCICLNEDEPAAASYNFMFLDTTDYSAESLDAVYVDGVEVTPDSSDLDTGIFTLLDADYDPGQDVTADFVGFENGSPIQNGLDVIKDILNIYGNVSYITDNYDTAEWEIEQARCANVGLWIGDGEEITIEQAIQKICSSIDTVVMIKDNGLITARSFQSGRSITAVIQDDEWLDEPIASLNGDEFLTTAVCKYNRDIHNDKYRQHKNDDYEDEIYALYSDYRNKDFETLLTTEAAAIAKTENVMELSQTIWEYVTRTIKTQRIDLELMQFITANHKRPSADRDPKNYEIVGIDKNALKNEVRLTMREVE